MSNKKRLIFYPIDKKVSNSEFSQYVLCSGGPDSIAVTHKAITVNPSINILYIDHGTGKPGLDKVVLLGKCLNKEVEIATVSPLVHSEKGWRDARRNYLLEKSKISLATIIVYTGHNLDDLMELSLMNLGSGRTQSMKPLRKEGLIEWRKPALLLRKKELLSYCERFNLEYYDDPTNKDRSNTRGKIRSLMKEYEEIYPGFATVVKTRYGL